MLDKSIEEIHEELASGKITSEELIKEANSRAKIVQEKYNAFVSIIDKAQAKEVTDELISGIPFAVKDNLATKDILTTGSSNTLSDYVPFYTATVVKNLEDKGGIVASKTVLDEFGMGGLGITGHTGIVRNPWDKERICGGSSAGSACAVAAGVYPYALGSDTGDSVRKPAAYCGIVGFKPTYGMLSRFGLFPFASSLDHVGVLTRSVRDAAIVTQAMKGKDKKDMTSWDSSQLDLLKNIKNSLKGKKVCYIKEICDLSNYKEVSTELEEHIKIFNKTLDLLKTLDVSVEEVHIDQKLLNAIPAVYAVISDAEATSNMSNLTGISFGSRGNSNNYKEMIKEHRTKGFSPLIKRRFVIGSYVLQKENQERYFLNAARARRIIVDKIKEIFKEYEAIILPVGSGIAPKINDKQEIFDAKKNALEDHLQIGNFGGFPSITIPNGFINKMPVGINITGNCYQDDVVLNIAYKLEELMSYKGQIAREEQE